MPPTLCAPPELDCLLRRLVLDEQSIWQIYLKLVVLSSSLVSLIEGRRKFKLLMLLMSSTQGADQTIHCTLCNYGERTMSSKR